MGDVTFKKSVNLKKEQVYKKDKSALNCLTVVLRHYQALFFFFFFFFFCKYSDHHTPESVTT